MPKRITIRDLADAAHCSIATVSIALNGAGRISAAKRREIERLAQTLGYQPNMAGRNLRLRRTDTIGLMFNPSPSAIFKNIFYVEVVEGLEETLYNDGFNLLLGSGRKELAQGQVPKFLLRGSADALILLGYFPDSALELLMNTPTPIFLLDSAHDQLGVDCLTTDGYGGINQAMEHLSSLGHRRIAMLAYDAPDYNIASRVKGFRAALRRFGLQSDECPILNQFKVNEELPAILQRVMRGARKPTAFLCVNDTLAAYLTAHLQRKGISVPEKVSVVGFDDDRLAQENFPPLTTVQIERERLGRTGAEMLLDRLSDPDGPIRKAILPVRLIVRESTAPPSKS